MYQIGEVLVMEGRLGASAFAVEAVYEAGLRGRWFWWPEEEGAKGQWNERVSILPFRQLEMAGSIDVVRSKRAFSNSEWAISQRNSRNDDEPPRQPGGYV